MLFFLPEIALQIGVMMKGDRTNKFKEFIEASEASHVLDRKSGLGILSNGHRWAWGTSEDGYTTTWGWLTDPRDESDDMVRVVAHLVYKRGMQISSGNPRVNEILQAEGIPFTSSISPPQEMTVLKYAWPAALVRIIDQSGTCQVVFWYEYWRFRFILESKGYEKMTLPSTGKSAYVKEYMVYSDILPDMQQIIDECRDPEIELSFKTDQPVFMSRLFLSMQKKTKRIRIQEDDEMHTDLKSWVHAVISAWEVVQKMTPSPITFATRCEEVETDPLHWWLRANIISMLVQVKDVDELLLRQ